MDRRYDARQRQAVTALATRKAPAERVAGNPAAASRLLSWIHREVTPGWSSVEVVEAVRATGGASYETWIVDLSTAEETLRVVIRIEPVSGPIEPYDIGHEARVLRGLGGTTLAVPDLLGHCADRSVIGRPFIVIEFVSGEILQYRTIRDDVRWTDPATRTALAREFFRGLADIQRVDISQPSMRVALDDPCPDELHRLGSIVDQMVDRVARRTAGWPAYPIFNEVARWLKDHAPALHPADKVLVHGDYKLGNAVWRRGRIVAHLDWEGASSGHPMQDLGYAFHPLMRTAAPEMMAMLAPFEAAVDYYESLTGRCVDHAALHYYVIYALFFHVWTVLVGLPSALAGEGDVRLLMSYRKLGDATVHLVTQINRYEGGSGVL